MRTRFTAGIALLGLLTSLPLLAQESSAPPDELETVVVTGERPGPGLWKISKGDHVMWVLGTYTPLPKNMTWRSQSVEARIAESREVLLPPSVNVDMGLGFFRTLTLIPAMIRAVKLPDKKTLQDVLPPETWRKWQYLRNRYMGNNNTSAERLRPSMAVSILRDQAYKRNWLTDGPVVESIVKSAAKKHKVRVRSVHDVEPKMKTKSGDIRDAIASIADMSDVECFTRDLDQLEPDIELLKQRANAWATGDVEALRHLHEKPDIVSAFDDVFEAAVTGGDSAKAARLKQIGDEYDALEAQGKVKAEQDWIAAASKALEKNQSTFALLPIREVVGVEGYVAKMRELGYEVEGQ